MSNIKIEIEQQLRNENVDIIHFVDISMLDMKQNRGLPFAILIGIAINPHFLEMVCNRNLITDSWQRKPSILKQRHLPFHTKPLQYLVVSDI